MYGRFPELPHTALKLCTTNPRMKPSSLAQWTSGILEGALWLAMKYSYGPGNFFPRGLRVPGSKITDTQDDSIWRGGQEPLGTVAYAAPAVPIVTNSSSTSISTWGDAKLLQVA